MVFGKTLSNSDMKKGKAKMTVLLLVLVLVPFSFFYFFSKGSHQFTGLPYLGPETADGKPFVFPDFTMKSADGRVLTKKDFEGKIILATGLQSSCPDECLIAANQIKLEIYKKIESAPKFKDVVIVSHLQDTSKLKLEDMPQKLGVDPTKWIIYTTEHCPFWDVELNGTVLKKMEDKSRPGELFFPRAILLIDKSFRPRGFYEGSQTIEVGRIIEEIRLLKKEYHVKD
jgi:protein SCO1/2